MSSSNNIAFGAGALRPLPPRSRLDARPSEAPGGKIRLGLMSSDLRSHPVGYFVLPLFDHLDERFELFAYSFYQGATADRLQDFMSSRSHAFRWKPEMGDREAAQMIGDDQLDFLIELGGSTYMNKLEVMAWRPAPVQASWLGYPHSAGLSTIDYLICDPHTCAATSRSPHRGALDDAGLLGRPWAADFLGPPFY